MIQTVEPSIQDIVNAQAASLPTPYYLLDEERLVRNLKIIQRIRERSGAKAVLALKCFSSWAVFDVMRPYLDGTTSSSLFEARLGHEKFGKETHAYSVAFSDEEIAAIRPMATKVIFNSISQLERFAPKVAGLPIGLRVNPGVSHSDFDLADPARKCSRLGETKLADIMAVRDKITGAMFHCNCENDDFEKFRTLLNHIATTFGSLLETLEWVSLGGGIFFTKDGYPVDEFAETLAEFSKRFKVQVYLEPGEAAITRAGFLVTKVLDLLHRDIDIAVVDAAVETHMLDLLIYRTNAKIDVPAGGSFTYQVAGRTCLAGDIFGTYQFPQKLQVGSLIPIADAAGYTLVKKNWFNGVPMPAIVVRRLDGRLQVVRRFSYEDYLGSLS